MSLLLKTKQRSAFGFSILVGALVWIVSPYFTGQKEPWDSLNFYYRGTLFMGGFVVGSLVPRRCWLWAVGIWLGQIIGFTWCMAASRRIGPLAPLGFFICLPLYSLWGLFGSYLGAGVGALVRRVALGRHK